MKPRREQHPDPPLYSHLNFIIMKTTVKQFNPRTGTTWTPYLATAVAEGFCEGEDATEDQQMEAWAFLISTRLAYSLQGFFGRTATAIIETGLIDNNGHIDWDAIDARRDNENF